MTKRFRRILMISTSGLGLGVLGSGIGAAVSSTTQAQTVQNKVGASKFQNFAIKLRVGNINVYSPSRQQYAVLQIRPERPGETISEALSVIYSQHSMTSRIAMARGASEVQVRWFMKHVVRILGEEVMISGADIAIFLP